MTEPSIGLMQEVIERGRAALREQFGDSVPTSALDRLLPNPPPTVETQGEGTPQVEAPAGSEEEPQTAQVPDTQPDDTPAETTDELAKLRKELETANQRYATLKGKYDAETRRASGELATFRADLKSVKEQLAAAAAERDAAVRAARELEEQVRGKPWENVVELNDATVDAIRRGARAEAEALIADLRAKVAELQSELGTIRPTVGAVSAQTLEISLDREVPGWREINVAPDFVERWLEEPDPLSGMRRMDLLASAYQQGDVPRIARLFRAYMGEQKPKSAAGSSKAQRQVAEGKPDLAELAVPDGSTTGVPSVKQTKWMTRDDLRSLQEVVANPTLPAAVRDRARTELLEGLRSNRFRP